LQLSLHISSHLIVSYLVPDTSSLRFYAVLTQLGLRVCELHGDVSQTMRYTALQRFRDNEVDVMVCTDVAARGRWEEINR
jgi:superfamily II DNA/RNA helicase